MRLAVRIAPRCRMRGVEVVDLTGRSLAGAAAERLDAALGVIEAFAPNTYSGLRRRLARVVIASGGVGYYSRGVNAAVIGRTYIERSSPEQLALVLVHEASHARLHRLGVRGDTSRLEGICVRAERAFAQRLPNGARLIDDIRAKTRTPWWTAEARSDRLATVAEAANLPSWIGRLLRKMTRMVHGEERGSRETPR